MSEYYIKRADAIKAVTGWDECPSDEELEWAINRVPTVERKRGEWEERETFCVADDNPIITEWQSARCSACGKYHTTPYMYYFDNFNFCPNCGAEMRKEGE